MASNSSDNNKETGLAPDVGNAFRDTIGKLPALGVANPKILLAAGDAGLMAAVRDAAEKIFPGAKIMAASDGVEACVALGAFMPDLIVVGMDIPNVDCLSIVRFVKGHEPYAKTRILILADLKEDDPKIARALNPGADGIINISSSGPAEMKPLKPESARKSSREDDEDPVLKPDVLPLAVGYDQETIIEIVNSYRETLPKQVLKLEEAAAALDLKSIKQRAHSIRGGAANLGGERLRRLAGRIEDAAEAGDEGVCRAKVRDVPAQMAMLFEELEKQGWK